MLKNGICGGEGRILHIHVHGIPNISDVMTGFDMLCVPNGGGYRCTINSEI